MPADTGARCPNCSRYIGLNANFCPICGIDLRTPDEPGPPVNPPFRVRAEVTLPQRSFLHRLMRSLFVVWLIVYPVISCGPVLMGSAMGGTVGGATAITGLVVGGVFVMPWLVGVLVLGLLTALTR